MARIVYTSVKKIEPSKTKKRRAPVSLAVSGVLGIVIIILVIVVWTSTRNGIGSLADNSGDAVGDEASRGVGSGVVSGDAAIQYIDLNPESGETNTVNGEQAVLPGSVPPEGSGASSDIVSGTSQGGSSSSGIGSGSSVSGGSGTSSGSPAGSQASTPGTPGPGLGSRGESGGSVGDGSSGGGAVPSGDTPPGGSDGTPQAGNDPGTGETPPPDEPPAEDPQEESLCVDEQGQIILLQHANSC